MLPYDHLPPPSLPVGHDVDDRVEGGVEVSDPEEDGDDDVGARAIVADGDGQVPQEEGQPAEQEGAHDDAQRHERLVLLAPRRVDAVALAEPWNRGGERGGREVGGQLRGSM